VWRPLIAWSDKFKFEQVESADRVVSPVLELLRRSTLFSTLPGRIFAYCEEPIYRRMARTQECRVVRPVDEDKSNLKASPGLWALAVAVLCGVLWGATQAVFMLKTVTWPDLRLLLEGAGATFLRVNAALAISAAWTVPVGVAIGFNPKLARIVQPIAQVMASVPATAFFPILLIGLVKIGGGLGIGSIALMLLDTQWYILFNVIAGAAAMPKELRDAADNFGVRGWLWWRRVALPCVFPYYVTGAITASGGAWNASVLAEVASWGNKTLRAHGLGAYIADATQKGDFHHVVLGIAVMSCFVLVVNRILWRPLYWYAERKYRLT
jgi:NitT/TauT family transport system permease protein